MTKPEELIAVVNDQDEIVGSATRDDIWHKGLKHRIVRVMLRNQQGQFLLQKRTMDMNLYPGCWDQSAGGHVDADEDYDTAAYRELKEEVGVDGVTLKKLGKYEENSMFEWRKLNRFHMVYEGMLDELPTSLQAEEVVAVQWFTLAEVRELIEAEPNITTDGLKEIFSRYYKDEA